MTSNIWGDYFGNEVAVREDQLLSVREYFVVEDQDALDATDHSPVWTDVELL